MLGGRIGFWRKVQGILAKGRRTKYSRGNNRARLLLERRLHVEELESRKLLSINLDAIPHQIVGNQDPGFAETGSGWPSQSNSSAYQGDIEYAAAGNGSDKATWTLTGLDPTKHYQFFATYGAAGGNSSDAPFTISDGAHDLTTVRLNQQCAPTDASGDGQLWESLGEYQITSGTASISLSDLADGGVVADALCAVAVAPPAVQRIAIKDTGDPGYSETGSGWLGMDDSAAYDGGFRYAAAGAVRTPPIGHSRCNRASSMTSASPGPPVPTAPATLRSRFTREIIC